MRRMQTQRQRQQQAQLGETVIERLRADGTAVEPIDEHRCKVAGGWILWPATGAWRPIDGSTMHYGLPGLVEAIRKRG